MPAVFRPLSLLLIILAAIPNSHAQEKQAAPGDASGKLYVLDAGNSRKKPQVLVVDPSNGKVIRTYRAGYQPDMTLSPDGKLLYISSSFENAASGLENFLDIYDTASGALLNHISNPEALQHKIPVYGTSMVMSPSGKRIYIEKYHWIPGRPGPTGCYTSVFDTESHRFLVDISVSNCGHAVLPADEEQTFYLVSTAGAAIDTFTITGNAGGMKTAHQYTSISLPPSFTDARAAQKNPDTTTAPCGVGSPSTGRGIGPVFLRPQQKTMGLILEDGSRVSIDLSSEATTPMGQEIWPGKWSGIQPIVESSGSSVYFGTSQGTNSYFERYDRIVRIDPATMATTGTMTTSLPFFEVSRSHDESTLFTVNPERAKITVIDAASLREIRQFYVGVQPILAIPAF
jgi:hypothetical protein